MGLLLNPLSPHQEVTFCQPDQAHADDQKTTVEQKLHHYSSDVVEDFIHYCKRFGIKPGRCIKA